MANPNNMPFAKCCVLLIEPKTITDNNKIKFTKTITQAKEIIFKGVGIMDLTPKNIKKPITETTVAILNVVVIHTRNYSIKNIYSNYIFSTALASFLNLLVYSSISSL